MNSKSYFTLILAIILFSKVLTAQEATTFTTRIDSLLNALDKNNKAWASVTIRQNDQVVYSNATGWIDYSSHDRFRPSPTPDTRYRIGSISKMFTTVMILQLVEEYKLSLDIPLSKFFKKITNAKSITIADLLNHHSGLYNFTNDSSYSSWMTEPRTRTQMRELFESQQPAFAPGEKGEYSNTNFVLLGYIIEDITGKSYEENLAERITSRIHLKNTKYGRKIENLDAHSSEFIDGKWVIQPETDMSIPGGAGALISTTPDLTAFITALFNGQLINESSLKSMTTIKDGFGFGIFKIPFYERSAFGHNGGIDGFSSSLAYFPDDKVAIAFCSNGLNYSMNEILIGILSCYFDKPYKIPDFKTVALPVEKLSKYEGEYTSKQLPLIIAVKQDKGKLTAQATGQPSFPLDAVSETEFRFDQAGIVMIFSFTDTGEVDGFTLKQGADYVYKKVVK